MKGTEWSSSSSQRNSNRQAGCCYEHVTVRPSVMYFQPHRALSSPAGRPGSQEEEDNAALAQNLSDLGGFSLSRTRLSLGRHYGTISHDAGSGSLTKQPSLMTLEAAV
ncbi:hypothetical protein RRG08_062368 [Elysia crispata]|uniref:Uncharacterized protein n=1 Tax=Elysia crispata TaxID=231223 RepID=A0AAE0YHB8_9GAST|nr:hypothetical protein RRG08_062368 [Elysia crispata]